MCKIFAYFLGYYCWMQGANYQVTASCLLWLKNEEFYICLKLKVEELTN